jgi:hypothetical protein
LFFAVASRRLGYPSRAISDAVYAGKLDTTGWPQVCGKLLVPEDKLQEIGRILATDKRRLRKELAATA